MVQIIEFVFWKVNINISNIESPWRLYQKHAVPTKFDIYVFVVFFQLWFELSLHYNFKWINDLALHFVFILKTHDECYSKNARSKNNVIIIITKDPLTHA